MKRRIAQILALGLLVLFLSGTVQAMPPPDPRFPEAGIGFEFNYLKSHAAAIGLKGFFPEAVIEPLDGYNLLVIMMDFSDAVFSNEAETYFEDLFFGTGNSGAYAGRSFALFFEDMAVGKFWFNRPGEGSALFHCPAKAAQTHDYYGTGGDSLAKRGPEFVKEAVNCASNLYNLRDFDNNGDGIAESIIVIHPGFGAEQTGEGSLDIWSHSVQLDSSFAPDGVWIKYALGPEKDQTLQGFSGIGIYAHEYTHTWGIPDLYDPDTTTSRGIGFYDLMSYGLYLNPPVYLSAWPRHRLGWLKLKDTSANLCPAELSPVESSGEGYLLYPNHTPGGSEYFLVTFNTREGNDELLPARGLLIWHVDESKWSGETAGTPNNEPCLPSSSTDCCSQHFLVALEQADAAYNLETSGSYQVLANNPCPSTNGYFCDAEDYWNSGLSFSETTTPGSKTYCGGGSGISLNNIKIDPSHPERIFFGLTVDPSVNPLYPPAITSVPLKEAEMGEIYQYRVIAGGSQPIEYHLLSDFDYPGGVTMALGTGLLIWTPTDAQIGDNHLGVEAENCQGTAAEYWDVTVKYSIPDGDGDEKSQGCGCDSMEGLGFLPLGMIAFSWFRRSRRGGRS